MEAGQKEGNYSEKLEVNGDSKGSSDVQGQSEGGSLEEKKTNDDTDRGVIETETKTEETEHNLKVEEPELQKQEVEGEGEEVHEEEGEEGGVEEEEDGETRCVCGELDPPDESGLYIQCEKCGVWQHGFCVGIIGGSTNAPDKYWCEQCKPNLHHLYITDLGTTRSIYRPAQERRRQNRRRQASQRNSVLTGTSSNDDSNRSSNNNNNSNLSLSNVSSNVSTDSETNRYEPPSTNESSTDDLVTSSGTKTDRRKLEDRKRATFKAREEKQYQIMLEKAIKESRMGMSNGKEDDSTLSTSTSASTTTTRTAEGTIGDKTQMGKDTANDSLKEETTGTDEPFSNVQSESGSTPASTGDKTTTTSPADTATASTLAIVEGTNSPNKVITRITRSKRTPSRRDSPRQARQARKRTASAAIITPTTNTSTQSSQGRKRSRGSSRTRNANRGGNTDTEIDVNKPVKPRIPPKGTSLFEMKRRASAILEFISRTQYELSQNQQNRNYLVQFIDNDKFLEKVDEMFAQTAKNFELMDGLTRKLILWEQKYVAGELQQ